MKGFEFEDNHLMVKAEDGTMMSIPYPMIRNSAVYNNDELEIQIPLEDNNEQHDVLCEMRFYIPRNEDTQMDEEEVTEDQVVTTSIAQELYQNIEKKANIDKNTGELICTLENLPLVVPRGKYTVNLYSKKMRLHGSTFNYKISYNNIKKAFLLPMNDGVSITI